MAVLSGAQIAQLAYQAGFREPDLTKIVAIAKRESGWKSDAWRTDNPGGNTGDVGLWQINYTNLPALQAIGVTNIQQLLDPVTNARAAFHLYQQSGGLSPWSMGPNGWTAGGDPMYGATKHLAAAQAGVQQAVSSGLINSPYSGGGSTGSMAPGATPGAAASTTGAVTLPADTQIFVSTGFAQDGNYVWAVYDIGNGVKLAYNVMSGDSNWKQFNVQTVSSEQWQQMGVIYAGNVDELGTVNETFGNFRTFFDSILAQVMGPYNPARNDAEVLRVLAEFAARPDMSEAELQNKLQATQWYQNHTQSQLEWNGLPAAEQEKRRQEATARAIDTFRQYTGETLAENDPRIANYIEQLASGALGWGAFSQIARKHAEDNPESPYMRDQRTEQEAQRQRGIDIENTAQNIRQTLDRWGVEWTNDEVMSWSKKIAEKLASDDDLMNTIQQQAMVLYPWKDPKMETRQAAQPWLSTYERVMEQAGSLSAAPIKKALTAGQTPWDFETELKRSSAWLGTRNARESMVGALTEVSRKIGYS